MTKTLKSSHFVNIYNFYASTPKGRRLSFENPLKSDISLISLISLKYADFVKISQFP